MPKLKVYSTPEEVPSRLSELGLRQEILCEAVQRGHAARASCTPNHPAPFPGIWAWAETVASLRELLRSEGWTRADSGNLPLTVDPAGRVSLIVSTGDENTGNLHVSPCTRSSKGPRTENAVTVNALQMTLFDVRLRPEDLDESSGKMTFLLLFHSDAEANEVRCELSRPIKMNEVGQVSGWAERIILPTSPLGGEVVKVPTDVPQTPKVVVKIKRRSA
jgi:hypothetical protein